MGAAIPSVIIPGVSSAFFVEFPCQILNLLLYGTLYICDIGISKRRDMAKERRKWTQKEDDILKIAVGKGQWYPRWPARHIDGLR